MKRDRRGRFTRAESDSRCVENEIALAYATGLTQGRDFWRAENVKSLPLHVLTDEYRRRGLKVFGADGSAIKPTLEQIRADGWTDERIEEVSFKNLNETINGMRIMVLKGAPCISLVTQEHVIAAFNKWQRQQHGRKHARCAR